MNESKNEIALYCQKTMLAFRILHEKELFDHMLVLLYSSIDVLGLLNADENTTRAKKATFVDWINEYMDLSKLNLSAIDIYSARCSVLHTHSTESDLSKEGKAKEIIYLHGNQNSAEANLAKERINDNAHIAVFLKDLIDSVTNGMEAFVDSISEEDQTKLEKVGKLLKKHSM